MRALILFSAVALLASAPAWAQTSTTTATQTQEGRYVVYFPTGSAKLDPEAMSVIAAAADDYRRVGSTRITVRGHTDTTGSPQRNEALSERRAKAVADELTRHGVPASAITTEGVGETDLAVQTGDQVAERQNRRVNIAVEQPAPPPPAPVPAPAPAPTPPPAVAAAPQPEPQAERRGIFSLGGYYGYDMGDKGGQHSHLAGLNLSFDYRLTDWISLGLEQAGFYHFGTDDEGLGGRSAAGIDFTFGTLSFLPYVGGNFGYLYGSGIEDDFFAGPEIGLAFGPLTAKVAYDMPFNQSVDDGVISATIGLGIRF
jgi:OmpA family protein